MSSLLKSVRIILLADVDVAAITTSISPKLKQDPTLPAVSYKQVSKPVDPLMDIGTPRVQIESHADTYEEMEDLADAIRYCLQRYKGRVGGVRIEQITYLNEIDDEDPVTGRQSRIADYRVKYREATWH